MATDAIEAKQHAHELIEQLGPGQLDAMVRLLEVLTDPENVPIRHAPIDDEPESEEEARAVAASREWFRNHEGIPFEEVVASVTESITLRNTMKEAERRFGGSARG